MARHTHIPVAGKALGRLPYTDDRWRLYRYQTPATVTLATVAWTSNIGVLDQGDLGSCTGNATVGALGRSPFWETLDPIQRQSLGEAEAVRLYGLATELDDYPGAYPPDDTGTDGQSIAKAAQRAAYIAGYTHAPTADDALAALQTGPVILGIDWLEGFDQPSDAGRMHYTGQVRGGHEVCLDGYDATSGRVWMQNSWGTSWGVAGRAYWTVTDFRRVVASGGDATVFVPLSAPAPTPDPDAALWAASQTWLNARHVGSNAAEVALLKQWGAQKGF